MASHANDAAAPWVRSYVDAVWITGLAAAVIEMAVVLPVQYMLGHGPAFIFRVIAAGGLGRPALHGGAGVLLLGAGIHVFVSVVAAAVYLFAARLWDDVLIRKPVISGMTFGAVCYVVMTLIVIPVSGLGYVPNPSIVNIWLSIAIHIFAFGLPIGVIGRWLVMRQAPLLDTAS